MSTSNSKAQQSQTKTPRIIINTGSKKIPLTDVHLALFRDIRHKEVLEVLLAVVQNWEYRFVTETVGSDAFTELAFAMAHDLSDYMSEACVVLSKFDNNAKKVTGDAS